LLVAQMQNQNPLNPQSNTEMAAQMAQFSSLQQSSEMSASLGMMQASSLLGSTVNIQLNSKTITNGVVQGVIMQNGTPKILVNDSTYDLNQVISIAPTPVATTTDGTTTP
jgi:flagellar basal-body rod modification protein FlgD